MRRMVLTVTVAALMAFSAVPVQASTDGSEGGCKGIVNAFSEQHRNGAPGGNDEINWPPDPIWNKATGDCGLSS